MHCIEHITCQEKYNLKLLVTHTLLYNKYDEIINLKTILTFTSF